MKELTLLFLVRDQELLLAMKKRGFGKGKWNGVGGKLDPGESVEQALVRESQEEIFVTPTAYSQVARIRFHEYDDGNPASMLVHVFWCTEWEGEPAESEEMLPRWFDRSALPYETMWADDAYWLPDVIAGKKLEAEFHMDKNDTITSHSIKHIDSF